MLGFWTRGPRGSFGDLSAEHEKFKDYILSDELQKYA